MGLDLPTIGFLASILPFPAVVRLAVPGGTRLQALVLGPRSDAYPHDPRPIADVEEVVGLVAMALRLTAGVAGASGAAGASSAAPTGRAAVVGGSPSSG